jgi:hypothetical protein
MGVLDSPGSRHDRVHEPAIAHQGVEVDIAHLLPQIFDSLGERLEPFFSLLIQSPGDSRNEGDRESATDPWHKLKTSLYGMLE